MRKLFQNKSVAIVFAVLLVVVGIAVTVFILFGTPKTDLIPYSGSVIKLPTPNYDGDMSVEKALMERRSIREYADEPVPLEVISQLLWAAQGITHPRGYRTAPSAGALYPLEIYLVAGNVRGLTPGVYHYQPVPHELERTLEGDHREALWMVAIRQDPVKNAAAVIVICAIYERTTQKYGERGIRYVHMEVGGVYQNIYLQATSLELGTVFIGAFDDAEVKRTLNLTDCEPLGLMPLGNKKPSP